jgi:hypothetical protein
MTQGAAECPEGFLVPATCFLLLESLAILELDHDYFCGVGSRVFGKMDVGVSAPELACPDRSGLGCPIRDCEVEGLVVEEDGAIGGMRVHDGFLAGTVPDSKYAY